MKPLVLTEDVMPELVRDGFADRALFLRFFHFVWGRQPSQDELENHVGPRGPVHEDNGAAHWSGWAVGSWKSSEKKLRDQSLAAFCQNYEAVELWFDVRPEAQLKLVWLLDYFRAYPQTVARLKLRLVDREMIGITPDEKRDWQPPIVEMTERELAAASAAWRAYREPTPEACVNLLESDLSTLPLLRPALINLLAELPSASTGLGASEMRMLEMIGRGYSRTRDLFYLSEVRQTHVFGEFEFGYLLDGLAFGPRPAISGLDDELRTLRKESVRDRELAYRRSRLSLTDFGKALVAHKDDFSRHNPIDRWWGGTHLTNDNLWRWNPALVKP